MLAAWVVVLLAFVEGGLGAKSQIVNTDTLLKLSKDESTQDWWTNAIFYTVNPQIFRDSNGDCYGDLKGIAEKVDHLKEMDVVAIVLPSIYKDDDFTDINPDLNIGNLDDFKSMTKTLSDSNIRVIMEFDFSSTSKQHPWFREKKDYYFGSNKPNNWKSPYGGSAWQGWDQEPYEYYLSFYDYNAHLNLTNPEAKNEIDGILNFWMGLGVRGFKLKRCSYLAPSNQLENETTISDPCWSYDCYNHSVTTNTKEALEIFKSWSDIVSKTNGILIADPYVQLDEDAQKFVDNGAKLILREFIADYAQLKNWIGNVTNLAWSFQDTVYPLMSDNIRKMIAVILPGALFLRCGDEINSSDRAFKWDPTPLAGFTSNTSCPYGIIGVDYYNNLFTEKHTKQSNYDIFDRLRKIRTNIVKYNMTFSNVTFLNVTSDDNPEEYGFFSFSWTGDTYKYVYLQNNGYEEHRIDMSKVGIQNDILIVEVASETSVLNIGDSVDAKNIRLLPLSQLVLSHGSISHPISLTLLLLSLVRFLFQ